MAVVVFNKSKRKNVTLLNPAEKGRKFSAELKAGIHATNDGRIKKGKNGKSIRLSDTQKAYRAGYLASRSDNAKCFKANKKKSNKQSVMICY